MKLRVDVLLNVLWFSTIPQVGHHPWRHSFEKVRKQEPVLFLGPVTRKEMKIKAFITSKTRAFHVLLLPCLT